MKSRNEKYSVIRQTDGKYAVWDNAMDWFATHLSAKYIDLSHEQATKSVEALNASDEAE
jgi:hypothetical protein